MYGKCFLILFIAGCSSLEDAKKWAAVELPKTGPTLIYGKTTAGCIQGAKKLKSRALGYKIKDAKRDTVFGHPNLISYIEKLAGKRKYKLKIGDLSQPRGGPIPGGHSSHQTGLDVDIDYPTLNFPYTQILYRAVRNVRVERVFVNYKIKKALCDKFKGRDWLQKIRPWWGHNDHFHVRLKCPEGMSNCQNPINPVPKGDSCDATMKWWFTDEAKKEGLKSAAAARTKSKQQDLPERCKYILSEDVIHRIPSQNRFDKSKF